MNLWPGKPYPLAPHWDGTGTNFATFSEHAAAAEDVRGRPGGLRTEDQGKAAGDEEGRPGGRSEERPPKGRARGPGYRASANCTLKATRMARPHSRAATISRRVLIDGGPRYREPPGSPGSSDTA